MEVFGYISAIIVGLLIGLIGGGGSILSIPIIVYLFHYNTSEAATYSLFIVGITSFVGTLFAAKKQSINFNSALLFGIPSVIGVVITRQFILPAIPENIIETATFSLSKDHFLLILFSVLMLFSAFKMLKKNPEKEKKQNNLSFIFLGLLVGSLTGLVGAGGGFLIVPALLIFSNTTMKEAVSTSLFIITINSFVGFITTEHKEIINWTFLSIFSAFSVVGLFFGLFLAKKIPAKNLKPLFGVFILGIATWILIKETLL